MKKLPPPALRPLYDQLGAEGYYTAHGAAYRNPHEAIIAGLLTEAAQARETPPASVLDLACGSGEATLALRAAGWARLTGCDPHTGAAYRERTGCQAETWSFADIAGGVLTERPFDLVVCSFALHLCEISRLPAVLSALAQVSPELWILTPHKRPDIRPGHGWTLASETLRDRVRLRVYRGK